MMARMGLDMRAYLEYPVEDIWVLCSKVFIHRNWLFYAIVGGGHATINPDDEAKGLPSQLAWDTLLDNWNAFTDRCDLYEIDEAAAAKHRPGYCSATQAEEYLQQGYRRIGSHHIAEVDEVKCANWLLVEELERLYGVYEQTNSRPIPAVEATLAAMRALPGSRLVLWLS